MQIRYSEKTLPVIRAGDVVIAGGSLAGIAAALELARAGKKVVLIEPRTYLGRELSATLTPWVTRQAQAFPSLVGDLIHAASKGEGLGDDIPLHMDEVKRHLEDRLLQAGIELFYASQPVGLVWDAERLTGMIIGNKSGRQVVSGTLFVDATEVALLAQLAGVMLQPAAPSFLSRNIEFDNVNEVPAALVEVPAEFGIKGNQIALHQGYRKGHVVAECIFDRPEAIAGLDELTGWELESRERCMRLASWLVKSVPEFAKAYLGNIAYELKGVHSGQMAEPAAAWAVQLEREGTRSGISNFATAWPSLWMLNPAVRGTSPGDWEHAAHAAALGEQLGQGLAALWKKLSRVNGVEKPPMRLGETAPLAVREPDTPQRGRKYARLTAPEQPVPVMAEVEVLVVGGGTSGAIAAYAAAVEGADTFVIEMNPGLGGTGTYGGVHSYWCGYRGGFVSRVRRWVNQSQRELGLHGLNGYIPVWNMDSKAYALEKNIRKHKVRFLYNAKVIGAVMEGNTVRGVVAATRFGPVAVLGKIVIDASGDGDVAAFAGAEFSFGSPRDHSVMWFILPQFFKPGRNRNHFSSPVDISNIEDYNRAILSGRRRGKVGEDHDHGIYVATRESRHIVGDVIPSLTDHLLHRAWEDVVCFAFSNNDIKGQIYSEWFRVGMIPPHLEIEIPYRALLPKGLENILVVGKAVSTTHDALPAIRMQPDFENMGGAAGLAAALAVRSGVTARAVDIHALHESVGKYKVLPPKFLKRRLKPLQIDREQVHDLVKAIRADKPLYSYSDMRLSKVFEGRIPFVDVTTAGPHAIPALEAELSAEKDPARRVMLAQALAMMGSKAGVPVLIEAILQALAGGRLPERDFVIRQVDRYSPDQAAMPAPAYLLFSLADTRDARALPVWQRVVDLLAEVKEEDIWSQRKGTFYYVDAVCVGAEKLGDTRAVPLLQQMHGYEAFHGKQLTRGFQADYLLERPAYLEVVIARALARCASPLGVATLITYLEDVRALLAEQAHSELVAISGKDFGKDPSAWSQWLEQNGDNLSPVPWLAPSDAIAAWNETVLIAEPE